MSAPVPRRPPAAPPSTLEDLRPLLVGPEQTRIQELERRLDQDLGDMVAEVLPSAVVTSRKAGDALAWAFEPILEKSVREIVRKDPAAFAEAISPAIGPAIRDAVRRAIQGMVQRFNAALNHSLTVQSVRWRIEAARTGRPYAEVVLLRTLVYRVEQLFLIHRESGLLIQHRTPDDVGDQSADQISAMLSALETFTREAFREQARLERFRVGELVGWVEHGPSAILVAIVRGTAPEDYETVLRQALERAHLEYGDALVAFRGDVAPLVGASELLDECLREKHELPIQVLTPRRAAIALLLVAATVSGLSIRASLRDQHRFARYVAALRQEPGLVVTGAARHAGRYAINGLRDPLAAEPASVWKRSGLEPERATAQMDAFYSLDPRLAKRRAVEMLRPPPGVELRLVGSTLEARGTAPEHWIAWARSSATLVPGVSIIDTARLHAQEAIDEAHAAVAELTQLELAYPPGGTRLPASQRARFDRVVAAVKRLCDLAPRIGETVRIEILGYADAAGTEERSQAVSQERAEEIAARLVESGIPRSDLLVRGAGVRLDVLPPACRPPLDETACARSGGSEPARHVAFRAALYPAVEG